MNSLIFDFGNGISIHNIIGRGIVITFPSYLKNKEIQPLFKQHVGDKWIFEFTNTDLSEKIVEVKGVEIFNSFLKNESPYALCFGGVFTEEHKKQMKIGNVSFRKIVNNVPMENGIPKKEIIEKLKKIEEQQNILRDAIETGESLSEVAKKHDINLVKLGD